MKEALLVIDVQNEYFTGRLPVTYPKNSFYNILRAMDTAAAKHIEIIVIQHSALQKNSTVFNKDSFEWKLHPAIANRKYSVLIEKNLPDSFSNTQLESWLREQGIKRLVISGYMTQMCCDSTARQAFHLGFSVNFLSDATGTLAITNTAGSVTAEELHRSVLVTQESRFSKVITTEEWINSLGTYN